MNAIETLQSAPLWFKVIILAAFIAWFVYYCVNPDFRVAGGKK